MVTFICLSAFFSAIICVIYLYAHDRGKQQVLDDRYNYAMAQFWARQDFLRENGYSYYNDNLEYVKNE